MENILANGLARYIYMSAKLGGAGFAWAPRPEIIYKNVHPLCLFTGTYLCQSLYLSRNCHWWSYGIKCQVLLSCWITSPVWMFARINTRWCSNARMLRKCNLEFFSTVMHKSIENKLNSTLNKLLYAYIAYRYHFLECLTSSGNKYLPYLVWNIK